LALAMSAAALTEGCVTISPLATTGGFPVDAAFTLPQSQTWARMKARRNGQNGNGQIIIGVKGDQPGLGYFDASTNSYSGFDILIAQLVAAGLGFSTDQIQYSVVASQDRETELENQVLDLVIASYSYTPERDQVVDFAGPYLTTPEALMVAKGDTAITGLNSITASMKPCEVSNSTALEINGVTLSGAIARNTYGECAAAIQSKDAEFVYSDYALLLGYAHQDPNTFTVIDTNESVQYYGIGLPLGDDALKTAINTILSGAMANGTWRAIFNATLSPEGFKADPPKIDSWS
jgi:glutamate transport system substrate-binding protein